ncbi:MAG TPA: Crp/Fnr family transcriptional regulator [Bacteroidales bacterium]|jgi:CRP-like cAMP-binding protein|nr:Crp/Fnr family transcriptional regulator [Bacteroidales bacterium]MDD4235688.1 Crp/Fnr family transcriptional regulator [Bacteroidales bacterium]MDY0160042.1 Crp/Fnr family transcriptional regulator [Bacteroidales bacterium]HXK81281.1 Crp/Fnr family transcriptional regulator [Bacteroidales bacterium]
METHKNLDPRHEVFNHSNSVFIHLCEKDKSLLFNNTTYRSFKKNEIIFNEGTRPSGLICLAHGKVKIFKEGVGGREQIVRLAKPGGFIGYRALFAGQNYLSSAVAIENSTVCTIDKDVIISMMKENPILTFKILKNMATELGYSNVRTVNLTQKHIRGRLAESLLSLAETYGFEEDGMTIMAYLSREDLANLSNMTTSNAIRTLSTFASERVIDIEGRRIKIMDYAKLKRISDLG